MKMLGGQMRVVAAALLLAGAAVPALADVRAGIDAWQAGKYEAAVATWRPLADKGDADAQFNMGQAYKLGRGVPTDLRLAQTWYEKAAQQGHEQAQGNLGLILYQNGQRTAALPWIKKAADRGDPRAQYVMGAALFNGENISKDWPLAYALMQRAAAQGLPQAATSISEMDQFIPLDQRQKGLQIAAQLEKSAGGASAGTQPVRTASLGKAPPAPRSAAASQPKPKASATPKPATEPAAGKLAAQAAPKPAPAAKPASMASAGGRWRVQLGAFPNAKAAQSVWARVSKKMSGLSGLQPSYEQYQSFTRLRVGPLANAAAAKRLCAQAKAAGQACFPVAP